MTGAGFPAAAGTAAATTIPADQTTDAPEHEHNARGENSRQPDIFEHPIAGHMIRPPTRRTTQARIQANPKENATEKADQRQLPASRQMTAMVDRQGE